VTVEVAPGKHMLIWEDQQTKLLVLTSWKC